MFVKKARLCLHSLERNFHLKQLSYLTYLAIFTIFARDIINPEIWIAAIILLLAVTRTSRDKGRF